MTDVGTTGPPVSDKGLKSGAIGLMSTTVIGVASTAPGYSLAASLTAIAAAANAEVGNQAPAILLVAFVPMLCIAAAYKYLNRADPDCGTSFTWMTRAVGPKSGWITGWAIIVADLVFMPSAGQIAGSYTFDLLGADGLKTDTFWVTVLGVVFILAMTWICVIGIELNARTQLLLLVAELTVLVVFSALALWQAIVNGDPHTVSPSLSWINPLEIKSSSALAGGMVIAVFFYWGWDTAVSVNEETKDSRRTPGIAAVVSTLVLLLTYTVTAVAAQSVRGAGFVAKDQSGDILGALGKAVMGSGWAKLLIVAVLTSAIATTQTTILPAARSSLAMGAHKAFPSWFAKVDPRHLTPANATWAFGLLSAVWYIVLTLLSENVLSASIAAVGLMIAFYYAATGYTCVIYFRRHLFDDAKTFLYVGLAPLFGAGVLTWVFLKSAWDFRNDQGSGTLFGVSLELVVGVGLLLLGIPLMLVWWARQPDFFRIKRDPPEVRPSPYEGEAPPLGGVRVTEV